MNNPIPEKISKLPKWSQEYIFSINRQLDSANSALKRFLDDQTESPFFVDEWNLTPRRKRFIQSTSHAIVAVHAGVKVSVFLPRKDDGQRLFGPEISFEPMERTLSHFPIGIMPRGINTIQLVHKDNMK